MEPICGFKPQPKETHTQISKRLNKEISLTVLEYLTRNNLNTFNIDTYYNLLSEIEPKIYILVFKHPPIQIELLIEKGEAKLGESEFLIQAVDRLFQKNKPFTDKELQTIEYNQQKIQQKMEELKILEQIIKQQQLKVYYVKALITVTSQKVLQTLSGKTS